eukprot:Lankesteria_metandrocarpae@DN832_c0_g1_i1.p1
MMKKTSPTSSSVRGLSSHSTLAVSPTTGSPGNSRGLSSMSHGSLPSSGVLVVRNHSKTSAATVGRATDKLISALECLVCLDWMVPPIYQCTQGHVLCHNCQSQISRCPTCRQTPTNIRCRGLERIVESLEDIGCSNHRYGCRAQLPYCELRDHEPKCPFKPMRCPDSAQCLFHAPPDQLAEHLVRDHDYNRVKSDTIKYVCNRENVSKSLETLNEESQSLWQNQIYSCHDKHFVLRVHRKVEFDPQYFISIVGLHNRHHFNRYSINIEGNHRTYSFKGPVWSVKKGFAEIERVRDCLILPENIVLFLSGGKGSENDIEMMNLTVSGTIMPPVDERRKGVDRSTAECTSRSTMSKLTDLGTQRNERSGLGNSLR